MTNIRTYDIARFLYNKKIPLLPKVFSRLTRIIYSCEIPYTANIHSSVKFAHKGLGVVIGHDAIIGKNTKILQNVTIGGRSGIRANPVIGENVLVGANSSILGKVIIGNNAQIGAHALVLSDVPPNATFVGAPAKAIKKK